MKLMSIPYDKTSTTWYKAERIPDTPRSIIIYSEDGGSAEGYFDGKVWFQYRWNCPVNVLYWREMPRYDL